MENLNYPRSTGKRTSVKSGIRIPDFEEADFPPKSPESYRSDLQGLHDEDGQSFEDDDEFEKMMMGEQRESDVNIEIQDETKDLKSQNRKLLRKIEMLEKWQREKTHSSVQEMEAKIVSLEQMLESSHKVSEKLEAKLKQEREEKAMLKIQIEALRRENESYKSEIDSAIQAKLALDDQNARVTELEQNLEYEKEKYKKLKFNQQMLEKTNRKLKQQSGMNVGGQAGSRFEDDEEGDFREPNSEFKRSRTKVGVDGGEKELMKLSKENEKLKEALKQEQTERLDQAKDIMELETRLKIALEQVEESEKTRGTLNSEINRMDRELKEISLRLGSSEELVDLCQKFLINNGIGVNSFMSEDDIFQQN